jgi:hypothetical protein
MFLAMDVDLRVGEVRQAAAVIEVHVGQDDVTNVLRLISEAGDLADRRLLPPKGNNEERLKDA